MFKCNYKQLLDELFVMSKIIKVEVGVISRRRRLRLVILTECNPNILSDLIFSQIFWTSINVRLIHKDGFKLIVNSCYSDSLHQYKLTYVVISFMVLS